MFEVYKITNKINNKIYIGITTKGVAHRWKQHIAASRCKTDLHHYNSIFKKAIRKYGEENFVVETIDTASSLEELKEKEKYYIQFYKSYAFSDDGWGYNSTLGGDGA